MAETIGVISDTHGLLRPEAVEALHGCNRIIHAGDVGSAEVLAQLRNLAPVIAVRGNVDGDAWAMKLPRTAVVWRTPSPHSRECTFCPRSRTPAPNP